jgi:hypothetical protein
MTWYAVTRVAELQAHAMSQQYDGMMQKANLRDYGKGGKNKSGETR